MLSVVETSKFQNDYRNELHSNSFHACYKQSFHEIKDFISFIIPVYNVENKEKIPKNEKIFQKMQKIFKNPLEKPRKMCYSSFKLASQNVGKRKDFLGGHHHE